VARAAVAIRRCGSLRSGGEVLAASVVEHAHQAVGAPASMPRRASAHCPPRTCSARTPGRISASRDARRPHLVQAGYGCPMASRAAAGSPTTKTPAVLVWRAGHGLIAIGFLASIGYVWWCALTGRRGPWLWPAIGALVGEGVLVVTNGGDCPLGPLGERIGDPVPLFELVLSPRAARRAVPTLGVVTAVGVGVLAARSRREAVTSPAYEEPGG
jgi:hypothetical protein